MWLVWEKQSASMEETQSLIHTDNGKEGSERTTKGKGVKHTSTNRSSIMAPHSRSVEVISWTSGVSFGRSVSYALCEWTSLSPVISRDGEKDETKEIVSRMTA
jgi:hypothetical protein